MPIINYKTNLTSLKYGMDRPGGGDSGQPFEQFPIEDANTPTSIRNLYERNRYSLDYPIRGGTISSLVNGTYSTNAALIDADRIKKFFSTAPQGTTFITKQTTLQLTNPRTQVPNSLQFVGISLGNQVLPVTQTYNPLNTLAQVAASGTGAHFNRQGVVPTIYESVKSTYQYIVGAPENNTEVTNRLAILRTLKLIGNTNFLNTSSTAIGLGIDPQLVNRLGISTLQSQLFNYPGGPGSVYGIGFTRIFRYTNTDITKTSQTNPDPNFTVGTQKGQPYSAIALTYQQLAEQNTTDGVLPVQPKLQDFRKYTDLHSSDYVALNLETRLKIGNPGAPFSVTSYSDTNNVVGIDLVNKSNPFYFNSTSTPGDPWAAGKAQGQAVDDIIKFAFECIDNDNPNGSTTAALIFRAFLEGQITDTNTAEYNTFKYLGRGETFRTYQGFDRSIGFAFKIFVQSRQEMLPLYQKLNQLISQVYPDYSPNYNLMRGNVVRLTIGDYLYRTPGFIESVNVTIDNSNTPWEILLQEFAEDDVRQLPHMVTVQCSFKPIMDILPRKVKQSDQFVPLIANKDHYLDPGATTAIDKAKLTVATPASSKAVVPSNQNLATIPPYQINTTKNRSISK